MLATGRLLASTLVGVVERRAIPLVSACSAGSTNISNTSCSLAAGATASAQWRFAHSDASPEKPEASTAATGSSAPSASSTTEPSPGRPQQPQASPLADQLRQASPTGRLFDLFASGEAGPSGADKPASQPGRRGPSSPASASSSSLPATDATDVISVVMRAVENCRPLMKVRQFKIGNRMVNVPRPLAAETSTKLAVKWIVQAAAKRREGARGSSASMADALATELLLAYQRKGGARTKREDLHKLALDNRANVKARWW